MGATPIGAALLQSGFSAGAVTVFLIAGPATNIASLATVGSLMGTRTAIWFLIGVTISALTLGSVIDRLPFFENIATHQPGGMHMEHSLLGRGSAVVLLIWFGGVLFTAKHSSARS